MSDTTFLRDFSALPAKPVTDQLTRLSGSYADTDARPSRTMPLPVSNRTSAVVSSTPTQKYSNAVSEAPPAPKVEEVPAPPEPEVVVSKEPEPVETKEVVVEEPKKVEKFTYGVVGAVPPGYKAAESCTNCKYYGIAWSVCQKCNFPCAPNYTCSDFELVGQPEMEEDTEKYSKAVSDQKELELSPIDKAVVDYESVLSLLVDGDVASVALNKVVERFSNRSDYADAFLKLKYRRLYEDKHGNLEGAFLPAEEGTK